MTDILRATADIDRRAREAGMPGVLRTRYEIVHDSDEMWCMNNVLPTNRRVHIPFAVAEAACLWWLQQWLSDKGGPVGTPKACIIDDALADFYRMSKPSPERNPE